MDLTLMSYVVYLVISLGVTIWVAHTLKHNGEAFLLDAFKGNERLAKSINHLLVVGFYLINVGYVSLVLRLPREPKLVHEAVELLSGKLGVVLIVLGVMHFFNLYIFSRYRTNALNKHRNPPVQPQAYAR